MTIVEFPLKPGQPDVKFKFTVPSTRRMELAAGVGVEMLRLRGQQIYAVVLMTCYALQWQDKTMTEDKASELIEVYRDQGGKMEALTTALVQALNKSGVYGEPPEGAGDESDPTKTTGTATTATT